MVIDLYFWTTPNGYKPLLFLEETGLPHRIVTVNISKGEQFAPDFLRISPNNRMPAMVDHDPAGGGAPVSVFESGAILLYLAEKTGRFIAPDLRGRTEVLQWLFWQMGNLGPMLGQNHHFRLYAPEKLDYAIKRYTDEASRLYAVFDKRLADRRYIAGDDYSIADMACYPWMVPWKRQGMNLDDFPRVKQWMEAIRARPATQRAYERGRAINDTRVVTPEAAAILFGQTAETVKKTS